MQSLDPLVLKLIKRNNISVEELNHFKNEVADYTNGTYTDILLGQPGETKESHVNSVFGAMKLGFDQIGGGEVANYFQEVKWMKTNLEKLTIFSYKI